MSREKWAHAFETKEDRRTKKRMAVLRVGASLFNERGFDRTTLDDIAEALNVTKRTLYYYIDSKEEILHECNLRGAEIMRDIVNRLYTFHLHADDPVLRAEVERWMAVAAKWDEPEVDHRMISRGQD